MPLYFTMLWVDRCQPDYKVTNFFEILTFWRGDPAKFSFGRAKAPAEDQDRGDNPYSQREPNHHLREVWLQHTESQRAGAEPLHQGYSQRPFGTVAVTEREGTDQAHHEAEGGVEKREEETGNRLAALS